MSYSPLPPYLALDLNDEESFHDLPPFDAEEDPFAPIYPVQDPPLHFIYAHQDVATCLYDLIHALRAPQYLDVYPSLAHLNHYASDPDFREIPYDVRHKLVTEFEYMITNIFPYTYHDLLGSLRPIIYPAIL